MPAACCVTLFANPSCTVDDVAEQTMSLKSTVSLNRLYSSRWLGLSTGVRTEMALRHG